MTRQSKDNVRMTIEGPADQVSRLLGSMRLKDEEESDPDVQMLRRSRRVATTPAVDYGEGIDINDLEQRRVQILQKIMVYVPQELTAAIVDAAVALLAAGPGRRWAGAGSVGWGPRLPRGPTPKGAPSR